MNGIIILGGFDPKNRDMAIKHFKACGASIIYAHGKKSLHEKPFIHLTASLRLASRVSKHKLVVITASWLDVLLSKLGASSIDHIDEHTFRDMTKELHEWIITSRILDRVGLRYGALHCCSPAVSHVAEAAFGGFILSPNTFITRSKYTWVEAAITTLPFTRCVYPDKDAILDSMNLNGNIADAEYLLVGDQINPRFKHFNHWPFHDDTASAFFITSLLHHLSVQESKLAWANARGADAGVLIPFTNYRRLVVVALGKDAEKSLLAMGIKPSASIPHPSWARRFNKKHEYLDSLTTIFKPHNSRGLPCHSPLSVTCS